MIPLDLLVLPSLDLLVVGVAVALTVLLGYVVFSNNPGSTTNRAFLFLAIASSLWVVSNYLNYQVTALTQDPLIVLWVLRLHLFLAVWYAFFLFRLCLVFPQGTYPAPRGYRMILIPFVVLVSFLTLTPLTLVSIITPLQPLIAAGTVQGLGMALFGITSIGLDLASFYVLFRRWRNSQDASQATRFRFMLIGVLATIPFILSFNLILPTAFGNYTFIPFGAALVFLFSLITGYGIFRYHLLNVKVLFTEILSFVLLVLAIADVARSASLSDRIIRSVIFIFLLPVTILLIRGVRREVEQREHIEYLAKTLEEANVKLKELDKLKNQFLSIASHDLRAPLTIVRNFISLLLDGTYGKLSEAGEEGLRQVFDRATDMSTSVDTYLNVSRIEQGRMKYDFIDIELLPLVQNAVKAYAPNAEKKGLRMTTTYDPVLTGVKAKIDVAKMNEVLNNLLDNSIKYTPSGSLAISLARNGQMARFSIKDTGVGMSKETIGKLFQLFSTADNSRKVNVTSTGVGLYISKAHVEAHGGKVWAESEGEGKGSTFIMELPLLS